jgi:flagellar biosynthesis/type III secretory pathway protein FliH
MDAVFRYIMAVRSQVDVQHLADAMGAFSPELSEQVMSTARELIEQGRQEGRVEGRVETLRATLLRQLVKRFGEVPSDVRRRIEAASATELDRWTDGVIEAATLAEIFDAA